MLSPTHVWLSTQYSSHATAYQDSSGTSALLLVQVGRVAFCCSVVLLTVAQGSLLAWASSTQFFPEDTLIVHKLRHVS
jgi:hypothetical protein